MNFKRILLGKISISYRKCHKWNEFKFYRFWSGRLLSLSISKFSIDLDCRLNWIEDMITGKPE